MTRCDGIDLSVCVGLRRDQMGCLVDCDVSAGWNAAAMERLGLTRETRGPRISEVRDLGFDLRMTAEANACRSTP